MDIYTVQTHANKAKEKDKRIIFKALLDQLAFNQEEIMKREKKEVRQRNKTNLVEEHKGSSSKQRQKYTHEMFATDEQRRKRFGTFLYFKR